MRLLRNLTLALVVLFAAPLALHAVWWWQQDHPSSWATADWGSTGTLAQASLNPEAMVRVYAARTGRWKGVFATHSWIVMKERGAPAYERWEKVGWGSPVRFNNYAPDGRWYSNEPSVLHEVRGAQAERLIPKIRANIARYHFRGFGDYRVWPGPNSNTFISGALTGISEFSSVLPPTAIGKDFPLDGRWFGLTNSATGFRVSLGGYAGLTLAWEEGIEINFLGLVAGIDFKRLGVKLPGFGLVALQNPVG